jgi:hypothetical protein
MGWLRRVSGSWRSRAYPRRPDICPRGRLPEWTRLTHSAPNRRYRHFGIGICA